MLSRNDQVARLVESVLEVEYGDIVTPKEDIKYEEISITNTDFGVASFNDSTDSITSNIFECSSYQQSNILVTTENTVISNVTETNHLQSTNNQQLNTDNNCNVQDCSTFTWLDF